MNPILVVLSVQDGRIKRSSFEALSRAVAVGGQHGLTVNAVILHSNASKLAAEASKYGASKILCFEDRVFDSHLNAPLLAGLEKAIDIVKPRLVVAASMESIKDVWGALAIRVDAAVLPDVAGREALPGAGVVLDTLPVRHDLSAGRDIEPGPCRR